MSLHRDRPLALIILDGWGVSSSRDRNAIAQAHTPFYDAIRKSYASTTLTVDGSAGAEMGHRIIGAGRLVRSDASRIADAVSTGAILKNDVLLSALARAASAGQAVHFVGLLSDGGVHSSQDTLFALLRMAKVSGVREAFVHGILDGRDVQPRTADIYVEALEIKMADIGLGRIASLCGRFYAMDSTGHWERTARAYTMMVHGEGERCADAVTAVRASFLRGISDEFISPLVLEKAVDEPVATLKNDDLVVFFNHRDEGMRQLARSIAVPDTASPALRIEAVCLTEYDPEFKLAVAFGREFGGGCLAEVLETERLANFRITETARSAHITTFFNGAVHSSMDRERHIFLQTADFGAVGAEPESKSFKIADAAIRGVEAAANGLFIVNFPAAAIAAETGDLAKTVEAVQFIDTCLEGVVDQICKLNGAVMITASHSGCENVMAAATPDTAAAATGNSIPLFVIDPTDPGLRLGTGVSLADVAPTLLGILGVEKPAEMTGRDLRIS